MPRIYRLEKLLPAAKIWLHYPHAESYAYWVGEDEKSARKNAAIGSTPPGKVFFKSPWMDPKLTTCVLDYDSSKDGVAGLEVSK